MEYPPPFHESARSALQDDVCRSRACALSCWEAIVSMLSDLDRSTLCCHAGVSVYLDVEHTLSGAAMVMVGKQRG